MNLVPQQMLLPASGAPIGVKSFNDIPTTYQGATVTVRDPVTGMVGVIPWNSAYNAYRAKVPLMPGIGSIGLLGSSITNNGEREFNGMKLITPKSPGFWFNQRNGDRYYLEVMGYSGQTTDGIRSHLGELIMKGVSVVVLEYGINNVFTAQNAEDDLVKLQYDCELLLSVGILPVIHLPHYSTSQNNLAGVSAYNIIGQEWALSRGLPCASALWAIADKTSKACSPIANTLSDGLHPASYGAQLIGDELYTVVSGQIAWRILPCGSAQTPYETFLNPKMTGSTATTETGFTGTKPTDWTLIRSGSATAVCSVGSDSDGSYLQMNMTFTAANESITIGEARVAHFAKMLAGKTYRAYADYQVTAGTIRGGALFIPASSGVAHYPDAVSNWDWSAEIPSRRTLLRSHQIVRDNLGGGWVADPGIRFIASAAGTATVVVRGLSMRESRW